MFRPRVIPCLLLSDGGLVKTKQFDQPNYIGDPINAVKIFNDEEADELVFLDIQATKKGRCIDHKLVKEIADEAFMPFAVGGGISSISDIRNMFNAGAEKVIVNSAFVKNPELVAEAGAIFGNQAIVVSLDVRRVGDEYVVYTHSGQTKSDQSLTELLEKAERFGAGEVFINSIDNDGMCQGYDLDLIALVSEAVKLPVIACGGAGDYDHLTIATNAGASALAAGSLFVYMGRKQAVMINYPDKEELKEIFDELQ